MEAVWKKEPLDSEGEKSKKVIIWIPEAEAWRKTLRSKGVICSGGVLCLLYCVGIGFFVAFGSYFFLVWGVIGAFCAAWAWVLAHRTVIYWIPRWLHITFRSLVMAGMVLLLIEEGMMIIEFHATAQEGAVAM